MTTEQFEKAKLLTENIRKLKSFLAYYDKYNISIGLDNTNENSFHYEVFHLKNDDVVLNHAIKTYVQDKLTKLEKDFDSL